MRPITMHAPRIMKSRRSTERRSSVRSNNIAVRAITAMTTEFQKTATPPNPDPPGSWNRRVRNQNSVPRANVELDRKRKSRGSLIARKTGLPTGRISEMTRAINSTAEPAVSTKNDSSETGSARDHRKGQNNKVSTESNLHNDTRDQESKRGPY